MNRTELRKNAAQPIAADIADVSATRPLPTANGRITWGPNALGDPNAPPTPFNIFPGFRLDKGELGRPQGAPVPSRS